MENNNNKKSTKSTFGFGSFINAFGIILLLIMLTYVGVNFTRDARVFAKPVLTAEAPKPSSTNTGEEESKGTIKYKKPVEKSSSDKSSSSAKKKSTKSKSTVTPTPTPDP